jgi:hypothetical protein
VYKTAMMPEERNMTWRRLITLCDEYRHQ